MPTKTVKIVRNCCVGINWKKISAGELNDSADGEWIKDRPYLMLLHLETRTLDCCCPHQGARPRGQPELLVDAGGST